MLPLIVQLPQKVRIRITPPQKDRIQITPPSLPPLRPNGTFILQRFDRFEHTIKSTIQEEIRHNTAGLQNEVRSIHAPLKAVESSASSTKEDISRIDQNVHKMKNLKDEVLQEVDKQVSSRFDYLEQELRESKNEIAKLKESKQHPTQQDEGNLRRDFLKEKCFAWRHNLMLMGLKEPETETEEKESIAIILMNRLSIPKPSIEMEYRVGTNQGKGPRPVLITFSTFSQKLAVWYKKSEINKNQEVKLWLQEDLPKPLRTELSALLRIQKRAKALPDKYPDVKIKDFRIQIQGKYYKACELDQLPSDLQASAIATPQSPNAVVFFGRASPLSNHHVCSFQIAGKSFTCVEHFLAWKKANLASDTSLAPADPSEHKKVLNSLKQDNTEKWAELVEDVLKTALRAKFKQNQELRQFLCDTNPKRLGEASVNQKWGIRMPLSNPNVLHVDKWNKEGNLLGRSLEVVRNELLQPPKKN